MRAAVAAIITAVRAVTPTTDAAAAFACDTDDTGAVMPLEGFHGSARQRQFDVMLGAAVDDGATAATISRWRIDGAVRVYYSAPDGSALHRLSLLAAEDAQLITSALIAPSNFDASVLTINTSPGPARLDRLDAQGFLLTIPFSVRFT